MRKVWFFGDSSTFCHGLRHGFEYYDKFINNRGKLWTEYICDYFGGEEINFGVCGASSDDIKFRLSTNLHKIDNNDVVVIQSTHPTRMNVFDLHGDYSSVHFVINDGDMNESNYTKEQIQHLKNYSKSFLVDNVDKYEVRDWILLLSLKRELELRGVTVIYWHHSLLYTEIKYYFGWNTIYDETNGHIDDNYHLGWESQEKFYNFIIGQYKKGNTEIIPSLDINDHDDVDKIHFEEKHGSRLLDNLYENVKVNNEIKHYDESHIFF